MSEPTKKARGKRRPALQAAIEAAERAGKAVKSVTVEGDKLVLVFGDNGEVSGTPESDWDERIKRWKDLNRGNRKA